MIDRKDKKVQGIEVSVGLLFGYCTVGFLNMLIFDKTFEEAFSDNTLIMSFAGIALSVFLYWRHKKKLQTDN